MLRWLGALVLFLAVAVFAVQNGQGVHLAYLGFTAPAVPLAYLILASLVLGAAVTVLLGSVQVLRLCARVADLERQAASQELASFPNAHEAEPTTATHEQAPLPDEPPGP